jgi:hypothetical protein
MDGEEQKWYGAGVVFDVKSERQWHKLCLEGQAGGAWGGDARDTRVKLTSMGTPRRRGRCKKCKIYGHYAKECKTNLKEDKQKVAHHTTSNLETGALLVAQVCTIMRTPSSGVQGVFLN